MAIPRWKPKRELTRQEEILIKRSKGSRKLFGFVRQHRHELFDESFQAKLETMYRERNEQVEKEIPHGEMFTIKRIDVNNVEFEMELPPTTVDKKYDLYVTILRKNRRYQ